MKWNLSYRSFSTSNDGKMRFRLRNDSKKAWMMPKWVKWQGFLDERPMTWIFEIFRSRPIRGLDFGLSTNRKPRFQPLQIWERSWNLSHSSHFSLIQVILSHFWEAVLFCSHFFHFLILPFEPYSKDSRMLWMNLEWDEWENINQWCDWVLNEMNDWI